MVTSAYARAPPQLCLFTLARRIPHNTIESLRSQSWYTSRFSAHYVFHEESDNDTTPALRIRYPPPVQLVSVRHWFADATRMLAPHDPICDAGAHDRITLLRHPSVYRRMCHFFYAAVMDWLPPTCSYALRVDGDCLIDAQQPDPALWLPRAISSTRWQGMDSPHVVRGMAALFAKLERNSRRGSRHSRHSSGGGGSSDVGSDGTVLANLTRRWETEGWLSPYTNLMFINLTWAREQRGIIAAVDRTNCIYAARWGDLPLWGATLRLRGFTEQEQLPLSYFHGSHGANVVPSAAMAPGSKTGTKANPSRSLPSKSGKAPARRFGDLEWLMARSASLGSFVPQRHLLDWRQACSGGQSARRSSTNSGSPADGRLALESVVARLRIDLSGRGVLCDPEHPCGVELTGGSTSTATRDAPLRDSEATHLRICLPSAASSKRLCEPFGAETWQQRGVWLRDRDVDRGVQGLRHGSANATEASSCFSFDLAALSRWTAANRASSPFLTTSSANEPSKLKDGLVDDPRLLELLQTKRQSSSDDGRRASTKGAERIRRAELKLVSALRHGAVANATAGAVHTRQAANETRLRTCAVVGNGASLRCNGARGTGIDGADAVFRAGPAQQFGLSNDPVGHSLRRFRLSSRQAGRRTTFRVDCLYAHTVLLRSAGADTCIVSRDWFRQRWDQETVESAVLPCCELKPMRTHYTLDRLTGLIRDGRRVRWFAGTRSGDATLDRLLQSRGSEGEALQSALSLCDTVDVYGFGRTLPIGAHGRVIGHAHEQRVGQCLSNASGLGEEANSRLRARRAAAWRDDVVGYEILLHVLHALGIIRWRD